MPPVEADVAPPDPGREGARRTRGRTEVVSAAFWHVVDRTGRLSIGSLLVVTVVLRIGAGVVFSAEGTNTYEFGHLARSVIDGDGYSYYPATHDEVLSPDEADQATHRLPSAHMPPVYAYVTAAAMKLGGPAHSGTVWALRGFNLVMACATVLVVFALARRLLASRRAATLAAVGFAVYPSAVYMATQASAANLYVPVMLAVLVLLLIASRSDSWAVWGAAGLTLGALGLLRSETVPLILLAAVWLWWASKAVVGRRRDRMTVVFVVTALLLPGAWLVRNSFTFDQPVFTITTTGGSNLWIGNHSGASGSQKDFTIPADMEARLDDLPPTDDYELRKEDIFREAALEEMTGDVPGTVVRDLRKLAMLLGADVYDSRSLNPAYLASWAFVAALGGMGLLRWWRTDEDRAARVLIVGLLAFSVGVPVVFFVLTRYKLPIELLLLVFAGGWLEHGRRRRTSVETPSTAGVA